MTPPDSPSRPPGVVSRLPGEISFNRLLWQLSTFLFGFMLLIGMHLLFTDLVGRVNRQVENEQSRLMIGELIVHNIHAMESGVYKMATTVGVRAQEIVRQDIDEQMDALAEALKVLTEGGVVTKRIRLNVAGRDQMIQEIHYQPERGRDVFVLEAIDLTPKLEEIRTKLDQLTMLLARRAVARELGDDHMRLDAVSQLKDNLRTFVPLFVRLKENANRFYFTSHQRTRDLQDKTRERQQLYRWVEGGIALVIVLLVMLFGIVLARQISRSNTRLRLAHDEMEEAKLDAESANKAKSRFLSNMSHELRTPLNAILGFTQLLRVNPKFTPSQKRYLEEVQRASDHLLVLINDVLDMARIESGRYELQEEILSVDQLAEDACGLVKNMAAKRGIHLNFVSEASGALIRADATRVKQVFINLLSNGIKYNRHLGSVHMRSSRSASGGIRIEITDTGYGVAEEEKSQLFQPFSRLAKVVGKIEGTGIGLALSRDLVEAMDGSIGFESTPGIGSTFWVEFPEQDAEDSAATERVAAQPALPKPDALPPVDGRILLVEDNHTNQYLIQQQLQLLGYVVDIANNGQEGLGLLRRNPYLLVLTDCSMPVMDGYEFAEQVRAEEDDSGGRLPVIAITANAMEDEIARCFHSGMDDHLVKPVSLEALGAMLARWVPRTPKRSRPTLSGPTPAVSPAGKSGVAAELDQVIDIAVVQALVGSDILVQRRLFGSFLRSARNDVPVLLAAVAAQDSRDLVFHAHKLKSSASSVGARAMAATAVELEKLAKSQDPDWYTMAALASQLKEELRAVEGFVTDVHGPLVAEEGGDPELGSVQDEELDIHCLVVDDDAFMRDQLATLLQDAGVGRLSFADGGEQALQRLEESEGDVNLVICDLNMPGMDGVSFLRHVAKNGYRGDIIPVSGEDTRVLKTAAELARAHQLNVVGELEKPVDKEILGDLLQRVGQRKKVVRRARRVAAISPDALAKAISEGALSVHYQPKVSVAERAVVGAEALARWQDAKLGAVSPATFIPLAEEHGLIDELTRLVATKAIHQAAEWQRAGRQIKVSINFSMYSISHWLDLPEWLMEVTHEAGVDPQDIILEVTETGLMENITTGLEVLSRLRLKGFSLSIDDFGTGYSTLNQLKKLPFCEFKVDQSFVHGASRDPAALAIYESSTELAHKLGLCVVAEGVEDMEDWNMAVELGCDLVQGYFVARPMAAEVFSDWREFWEQHTNQFFAHN